MADRNAEDKFRRDALNVINASTEVVSLRLDRTEQTVARLADAVEKQAENLDTLSANVARLERGISQMVAESAAQRETVNNLIKLATALVDQRAS